MESNDNKYYHNMGQTHDDVKNLEGKIAVWPFLSQINLTEDCTLLVQMKISTDITKENSMKSLLLLK